MSKELIEKLNVALNGLELSRVKREGRIQAELHQRSEED